MATTLQRESAKIYDFPARGRFALNARLDAPHSSARMVSPSIISTASGAWYHEEAIRESEQPRRN